MEELQKVPEARLRTISPGDFPKVLQLIDETFHDFEYLPRIRKGLYGGYLTSEGSFVVESADGTLVGSICLASLPRRGWFETRYLAAKGNDASIARALIVQAEEYAHSMNGERLKAFVPMVQPYVDYYKDLGFVSVRRDLRMVWDLEKLQVIPNDLPGDVGFDIGELSGEMADEASRVWGRGMTPHWDWWFEERGGLEAGSAWVKDSVRENDPWLGAFDSDDRMIGVTVAWPDSYEPGASMLNGVYVLPEERGRGIGSGLLHAIIARTKAKSQRSMRVYTMSPLDHLAPGPIMYLKSGGTIEAEYTRLEKIIN